MEKMVHHIIQPSDNVKIRGNSVFKLVFYAANCTIFFFGNLSLFTRFQRKKISFVPLDNQLEHDGTIKHLSKMGC